MSNSPTTGLSFFSAMDKMKEQYDEMLLRVSATMSRPLPNEDTAIAREGRLPSVDDLRQVIRLLRAILFPDYFDPRQRDASSLRQHSIGVNLDALFDTLRLQVKRGLRMKTQAQPTGDLATLADETTARFIEFLPELKRLLITDVEAMYHADPAVSGRGEVIFCYPVMQAMINYRAAHRLLQLDVPLIPRIITELAHSQTGIDIHPGAEIGEYFAIDHGTGVVIGETCRIGRNVTLYQGVTLGAKNFTYDQEGHPLNLPRHPIIEDNVTIYSNASVLGRVTIGHDSVIGGNVWITHDVPPHSRISQVRQQ